ncbi:MAG: COX15/CtaA family protein [Bdellovibrionaceae bacterium]|nr:COX15/CtaA family protein [Pseudobdellovibrionaceae bacterium]
MKTRQSFFRFAQFLLIYTLLVILWGAWVRISHSGDGCGDTWPLCHGQIIPDAQQKKTWVEFSHRITSGLFGLIVLYVYWQARKLYPKGSAVRKAALACLIFMITEALLGAKLVLFGLVGSNDSAFRLFAMSLHQINSMLLSGSVAMLLLYASGLPDRLAASPSTEVSAKFKWGGIFLLGILAVAVTGGFAALSTTLFPATSLLTGWTEDFAPDAHYLIRLRISHPVLATLIGGGLSLYFWLRAQVETRPILRQSTLHIAGMLAVAVVFGYLTLFSLAPIWMKVVHLLIAHLVWISLLKWVALKTERELRN